MAGVPVSGALLVIVIVPELVIGEPDTDIPVPPETATLVTVPEPNPDTESSTYFLLAASVSDDTVSTPCIRPAFYNATITD